MKRDIIAIDPGFGKRSGGNAVALFEDRVLFDTRTVRLEDRLAFVDSLSHCGDVSFWPRAIVLELPQADKRFSDSPIPLGDIIQLTRVGVGLAYYLSGDFSAELVELTPTQWKGSEAKPIQHARMWEVLTSAEREVLGGAKTKRVIDAAVRKGALDRWRKAGGHYYPSSNPIHNELDAAALGCVYLGRLEKR